MSIEPDPRSRGKRGNNNALSQRLFTAYAITQNIVCFSRTVGFFIRAEPTNQNRNCDVPPTYDGNSHARI